VGDVWYTIVLWVLALCVLAAGVWFVRWELRRPDAPAAAGLWVGYALVALIVVLGAGRTSWVVLS
jgi:uncharacterized membrane protein